jgi:hypothetical protein
MASPQARQRLGEEPVRETFMQVASPVALTAPAAQDPGTGTQITVYVGHVVVT